MLPGSTLPLSIDSAGSFELVKLLHEKSSHQALEQKPSPHSKLDFTAASPGTTLTVK